jgi:hypothetical protein
MHHHPYFNSFEISFVNARKGLEGHPHFTEAGFGLTHKPKKTCHGQTCYLILQQNHWQRDKLS